MVAPELLGQRQTLTAIAPVAFIPTACVTPHSAIRDSESSLAVGEKAFVKSPLAARLGEAEANRQSSAKCAHKRSGEPSQPSLPQRRHVDSQACLNDEKYQAHLQEGGGGARRCSAAEFSFPVVICHVVPCSIITSRLAHEH